MIVDDGGNVVNKDIDVDISNVDAIIIGVDVDCKTSMVQAVGFVMTLVGLRHKLHQYPSSRVRKTKPHQVGGRKVQ